MSRFHIIGGLAALAFFCLGDSTFAASVNIVALGASNTYGSGLGRRAGGVSPSQAYPAQLESMLNGRGIAAHVSNAGVPGDTTSGMYARLNSAVPEGTQIVIVQPGGNDARKGTGEETGGNVSQIISALKARGIKIIMLDRILSIAPRATHDPDGQHLDAQGHAAVAAWLLPKVMAIIGHR